MVTNAQEARPLVTPTDEDRFRSLYASVADDLIRFLQRRVAPSQVEDVAAESFLAVWRRISDLPTDPSEARAWTFGVARRCAMNALRSSGRLDALAVRIADHPRQHLEVVGTEAVEARLDLVSAWRLLDPADQETLALTAIDELTSAEAGQLLGIPAATYRVRLMRARRTLRALLEQEN